VEKYGPLFHRNGAGLWPKPIAKLITGVLMVIGLGELVLGIESIVH